MDHTWHFSIYKFIPKNQQNSEYFYTGNFIHKNVTSGPLFFIYETLCNFTYEKVMDQMWDFREWSFLYKDLVREVRRRVVTAIFTLWEVPPQTDDLYATSQRWWMNLCVWKCNIWSIAEKDRSSVREGVLANLHNWISSGNGCSFMLEPFIDILYLV